MLVGHLYTFLGEMSVQIVAYLKNNFIELWLTYMQFTHLKWTSQWFLTFAVAQVLPQYVWELRLVLITPKRNPVAINSYSFVHFQWVVFLYCWVLRLLYTSCLSAVRLANIFSHSVSCFFIFLMVLFSAKQFKILMWSSLFYFFLLIHLFLVSLPCVFSCLLL